MSVSEQFQEYKELITKHPNAICYDLIDKLGNVFRYHRYNESHAFAAILDKQKCFHSLIKDIRLH